MYDPEPDIRDYYRTQIKELGRSIERTNRRDPGLHKLRAELKLVKSKLAGIADHKVPEGALRDYGSW